VVTNLLSNACKFGVGRPIEVEVARVDERARLVVTDHGIGVHSGAIAHIFDKFSRAVSAREYGGFGLGLYIARSITGELGGSIAVDSVPGERTSFIVDLPLGCPSP